MKQAMVKWAGAGIALLLAAGIAWAAGTDNPVVKLEPTDSEAAVMAKSVLVRPTPRQLAWQRLEFAAFAHFGMNTFTGKEWGDGTEDEKLFNPTDFDADLWAAAVKAGGMKMLIVTAKHHDGFCLWPSAYTEHSVKNSPWRGGKGDVIRELADACRRHGIKFGVYLSPWDRHEKTYGTPAYNDYYKNQLRELLTNYGEISDVWMDGAGKGEAHDRMVKLYDWAGFFALIRELQPQATISMQGPDVRWVGNESGLGRETEWSVLPSSGAGIDMTGKDLGSRAVLMAAAARGDGLAWQPAEVDVSIRPGWFYHQWQDLMVRSVPNLVDIYFSSVGMNSQLLLNLPPDRRGLINERDAKAVKGLNEWLTRAFKEDLALGAISSSPAEADGHDAHAATDGNAETFWAAPAGQTTGEIEVQFKGPKRFNCVMLQEPIREGQRVEGWVLEKEGENGGWREVARGTTIGYKRLVRFSATGSARVRLRVLKSRTEPQVATIGLYLTPPAWEGGRGAK